METIAISPCSNPEMTLHEALSAYSQIGYRYFEAFSSWVSSSLDIHADPDGYRTVAQSHGMQYLSFHLPPVTGMNDGSLETAVHATAFARQIGAEIVLFKAATLDLYIQAAPPYLDATEALGVTPVLQNHAHSPLATLDDFRTILAGVNDPRLKTLLEVGHFHTVGVSWKQGYDLLGDSIRLVHIKDQIGPKSVRFGTGEIDLPGLFRHMRSAGYTGGYVVEMENEDRENTLDYLEDAVRYLDEECGVKTDG